MIRLRGLPALVFSVLYFAGFVWLWVEVLNGPLEPRVFYAFCLGMMAMNIIRAFATPAPTQPQRK